MAQQGPQVAPKSPTIEEWSDVQGYLGQVMVTVDTIDRTVKDLLAVANELKSAVGAVEQRVGAVEASMASIADITKDAVKRVMDVRQRLEKDMRFEGGEEFYATFGGRIGEEVRASIRAEVGGLAGQVYAAVDAHMKQNPVKMPSGSAWVPFLALVSAVASAGHLYMSYQAARNYVPADVNVKVNGVTVPHGTGAASPVHNGRAHPMARASMN